jgi:hypothetical protein
MVESGERYPGKVEIIEPNVICKNCSIPEVPEGGAEIET